MNLIKNVDNPNLIKVYDIDYSSEEIKIYMEKCAKGDLNDQFKKKRQNSTWYSVEETMNII